jgi:hypothetical protein
MAVTLLGIEISTTELLYLKANSLIYVTGFPLIALGIVTDAALPLYFVINT